MHLLREDSAQAFAKQLLGMDDGKLPFDPSTQEIYLPQDLCQLQSSIDDLENIVFPNITSNLRNHDWLCECAILVQKNNDVNRINDKIQLKIPGESRNTNLLIEL
ncbi:ATP-dependent DNA helicase [Trichonephila inaurata madagascariensis]|uniref:ATP-dependent DNA helicase n=1 Tax=Trichonephila inaurata madagascariensis TaxID=2747483 RepID=A0A8X7CV78_9ARAC|nr:ATP-dependent DNA helicase [Trichonephila inaurata madagascariensis]